MELKDNTVIVVLGASGDLAKKKTVRSSRATCYLCMSLTLRASSLLSLVL
jgi:hypothetical protein